MKTPDFSQYDIYHFKLYEKQTLLYQGAMNQKAWEKTIETTCIWEYRMENGRVIEADFTNAPIFKDKNIKSPSIHFEKINVQHDKIEIFISLLQDHENDLELDQCHSVFEQLEALLIDRKEKMPANSYTTHLFHKGEEKILKKIGEETIEVILARDRQEDIIYETADLIYHLMTYFVYKDIPFAKVLKELKKRMDGQ